MHIIRLDIMDHPYITSTQGLSGFKVFANLQYCCSYADIMGGSEKVKKCADVIYEWSLTNAAK